jgi:DNA mismatch repair ATPase MutL
MEESSSGKVIRLDKDDIRQISTSQVIASIAGGCRELIDNALDAGATSIGMLFLAQLRNNTNLLKKFVRPSLALNNWK